jgi:hypothetical protein
MCLKFVLKIDSIVLRSLLTIAVNHRASWPRTAASGDGDEAATVQAGGSSNAAKANAETNEARRTYFMIIS